MATIYDYGFNTENLGNKTLMVSGAASAGTSGLAGLIAGFSALPVIGIIGGGVLAIAGLFYYAKNKISSRALNDYLQNAKAGDKIEIKYSLDKNNNLKTNLPNCVKLSESIKNDLEANLRNGHNNCYKLIVEKAADGKYSLKNKLKNAGGVDINSAPFELDLIKYQQDYSLLPERKKKTQAIATEKKNTNMTDQEVLKRLRSGNAGVRRRENNCGDSALGRIII